MKKVYLQPDSKIFRPHIEPINAASALSPHQEKGNGIQAARSAVFDDDEDDGEQFMFDYDKASPGFSCDDE